LYINQDSGKYRGILIWSSDLYYSKVDSLGLDTSLEVNGFDSVM